MFKFFFFYQHITNHLPTHKWSFTKTYSLHQSHTCHSWLVNDNVLNFNWAIIKMSTLISQNPTWQATCHFLALPCGRNLPAAGFTNDVATTCPTTSLPRGIFPNTNNEESPRHTSISQPHHHALPRHQTLYQHITMCW